MTGVVELICGCMFSGKTEELLRRVRTWPADKAVLFKHHHDHRYSSTCVTTHRGDAIEAITVGSAAEVRERLPEGVTFVGIDEGHFYDPDLARVCTELAASGCTVVVTGLDLDSWGRPFGQIMELRRQAGTVSIKRARCACCGREADHTQRKTAIVDGNMVGGAEDFEPRCLKCWTPPPEEALDQVSGELS